MRLIYWRSKKEEVMSSRHETSEKWDDALSECLFECLGKTRCLVFMSTSYISFSFKESVHFALFLSRYWFGIQSSYLSLPFILSSPLWSPFLYKKMLLNLSFRSSSDSGSNWYRRQRVYISIALHQWVSPFSPDHYYVVWCSFDAVELFIGLPWFLAVISLLILHWCFTDAVPQFIFPWNLLWFSASFWPKGGKKRQKINDSLKRSNVICLFAITMKGLSLFESSKEIFSKTGVIDSQTLLLMKKREDISKCNHVSLLFCEILLSSCCVQRMRHYYGREITIKSTRKTKKSTLIYGCQDSFRIFFVLLSLMILKASSLLPKKWGNLSCFMKSLRCWPDKMTAKKEEEKLIITTIAVERERKLSSWQTGFESQVIETTDDTVRWPWSWWCEWLSSWRLRENKKDNLLLR